MKSAIPAARLNAMRRFGVALLLAFLATSTASADFDPRGRGRKPKVTKPTKPTTTSKPRPTPPKGDSGKPPAESGPSDEALIKRYRGIVLNQPDASFPMQRLAELYRARDGNLDKLVAEFEAEAAKPDASRNVRIALAGVYRAAGKITRAIEAYEAIIRQDPKSSAALMSLARLFQDQGQDADARSAFERALPLLDSDADREQVLRLLMKLCLNTDDLAAARRYHEQLIKRTKGSFFVRAELGAELLDRGKAEEAEEEFRKLVKAAHGDNRALAPALRDLGKALAEQNKHDEALEVLNRALRLTSPKSGLRREMLDVMVQVYRSGERLPEVVALLEKEAGNDFARLRLLGSLYEEQGRIDDALARYQKALQINSKDLEVRLRMVQLLQIQGQLDQAIREYAALIRAAPHNPDFVFRMVEALLQRGERERAMAELTSLERRSASDEQVQATLVEFYERLGEKDRALALLQKLTQRHGTDPQHLIELGGRYYREGDLEKAKRTWKRILQVVPNRSRGLQLLGEVYLDHDMPKEALEALEEAAKLSPNIDRYKKALALAHERVGASGGKAQRDRHYTEAQRLWQQLLDGSNNNPKQSLEARRHIVTLWGLDGSLDRRVAPLERNLKTEPPDLDSGRLLSQVYMRLRRIAAAERVLRTVIKHAPGDVQSHLMLERALVQQHKLEEAVEVLAKLVEADPNRARETYQRMAKYSAQMYRDDDAIRYAAKAVQLSPDDAAGHQNLAEMYARRQDVEKAIRAYRTAISKNDRLFPAYFELAQLLIGQQRTQEADKLLRRVMRSAIDEELLARATRLSVQINLGQGTLESLERELLPVALANPHKPIYRRLLVEVYGSLTFPLIQQAQGDDPELRAEAKAELKNIGRRAVKPLLDALSDPRGSQQQVAIELLTHLRNPNASQALFTYATGEGEPTLRVRAMIAAGATDQASMLPEYEKLLLSDGQLRVDQGDPVALAAAWSVCRLDTPRAAALVDQMLDSGAPGAQVLAAISVAQRGQRASIPKLLDLLGSTESGNGPRAAAAFALGVLNAERAADQLAILAASSDGRVRSASLVALARLRDARAAMQLATALVSPHDDIRRVAASAAAVLVSGTYESLRDPMAVPSGRVDEREILESLAPRAPKADQRARAVLALEPALVAVVQAGADHSIERLEWIARALLARGGRPAFGELTNDLDAATPEQLKTAEAALDRVAAAAVPAFVASSVHPTPEVRAVALSFLSQRREAAAKQAVVAALSDDDLQVRRLVLDALSRAPQLEALPQLHELLEDEADWNVRILALQALSSFAKMRAQAHSTTGYRQIVERVRAMALSDDYSFVREAAARTLLALDPELAPATLRKMAESDPEVRVREAALGLLSADK